MIIERLKYCIEILFSKHYALYYYNRGVSGKCRIKASKEFFGGGDQYYTKNIGGGER